MTAVPTLREELTRKTLETIEELLTKRSCEQITAGQLDVGIDAIFQAVSGEARAMGGVN